jgi:2-polyprenyl-6-methoxyphenol hydroxylase-like FAD-dependent oxidoreductase
VIRTETADLLIGADGIHSAVRRLLYPDEGPPKWNGAILWRAVTRARPFLTGRSMFMAGHARQKFVSYPITMPEHPDGEALINWVAEIRFGTTTLPDREDWNRRGNRDDFLPAFAEWRFDWLDIPGLIRHAEAIYEYPMVDRDPLGRWSFGSVTLLGDAAHPMLPYMAQGASQSIEDAYVLARCLGAGRDDPEAALGEYAARRYERTAAVQAASREAGRVVRLTDAAAVAERNARLAASPEAPVARFDWLWRYDVERAIADGDGDTAGEDAGRN